MTGSGREYFSYSAKIATLYAITWFIDLLDSTILNVALPKIAVYFHTTAIYAEWTIVGFLLAFTSVIAVSGWLGDHFGPKRIFILGQVLYFLSSLGCGFAWSLPALIGFRILQGVGGGMVTPVGGALLIRNAPKAKWSKYTPRINMISLIAPAIGPVFAGYVTTIFGWRYLFFLKLPIQLVCLIFSFYWIREEIHEKKKFDWPGFGLSFAFLVMFLYSLTIFGEQNRSMDLAIVIFAASLILFIIFFFYERKAKNPLIPFSIFRHPLFSVGNIIQSATNIIFLGIFFITAFYFQYALNKSIIATGWILSSVTPGMMLMQPIISKFYNRIGPTPFVTIGLILLTVSLLLLCVVDSSISAWTLALIIFLEGMANSLIQSSNVMAIFSELSKTEMSAGSALYNLFKQTSGAFGVALSTMLLTVNLILMKIPSIQAATANELLKPFKITFFILSAIPFIALLVMIKFYPGKKALVLIKK